VRQHRPAFTLLELLAVIAIIGVLVTLLLPIINKARESAHQTVCQSNQRQIFAAAKAFANDHNESCPGSSGVLPPSGPLIGLSSGIGQAVAASDAVSQSQIETATRSALLVCNYLGNSSVFRCPEHSFSAALGFSGPAAPAVYHYMFNMYLVGDAAADPVTHLPKFSNVFLAARPHFTASGFQRATNPTACVFMTENEVLQDYSAERNYRRLAAPIHGRRDHRASDGYSFVHADYANCTYIDGHTESIQVDTLNDVNLFSVPTDDSGLR